MELTEFVLWFNRFMMSLSPLFDGNGIVPPFCLEEDDRLKIYELDRTDELLGWSCAGFVALAMRLFEASIRLSGIIVLFYELLVPLTEELMFSGGWKRFEFYLTLLFRESEVTDIWAADYGFWIGSCIDISVFRVVAPLFTPVVTPRGPTRSPCDFSSSYLFIALILCFYWG